jgi:hypothetical protein
MGHVDPLLGNELTNTFPWRWIVGNQFVMDYVSVDIGVQQAFPSILICYIRGHSDQNRETRMEPVIVQSEWSKS